MQSRPGSRSKFPANHKLKRGWPTPPPSLLRVSPSLAALGRGVKGSRFDLLSALLGILILLSCSAGFHASLLDFLLRNAVECRGAKSVRHFKIVDDFARKAEDSHSP